MASCLDLAVRGHTFITYKKKFFFEKADPKTPTLTCAQNLCMEETCKLKN